MSKKTTQDYLIDLLAHLDKVEDFAARGKQELYEEELVEFAIIRAYEVIGEIVKRLPPTLLNEHPEINWQRLARFRDFLAHNYDQIITANVWAAVEDVPTLRQAVQNILAGLDESE